jgi:hypothetical protein
MPLVSLDEFSTLVQKHPRYEFLSRKPQDVVPESTHFLLDWLKVQHLWQLLTFSNRELCDEMRGHGVEVQFDDTPVIQILKEALFPMGLATRDSTPFAIRVERKPPVFIRSLSDTAKTFTTLYSDATYYWNRWQGMRAQARFATGVPDKLCLVFRSESLKLGHNFFR